MKGKKFIIIAVILVLLIGGLYYFLSNKNSNDGEVYVMPVSSVTTSGQTSVNSFSGVVEALETIDYKLDASKTLKETFVSEGDEVKKGDKLFSYDTNSISLEIEQIKLDIQRLEAEIKSNKEQIESLKTEREKVSEDQKLDYSLNIQQLENANQSTTYTIKTKNNELASKQESLKNAIVYSSVDGTVKSISKDKYSDTYISVMQSGEYLVKGTINEMNIQNMYEGTLVNVYSRIDDTVWTGYVSKVDMSKPVEDNSGYYYGSSGTQSSKYYFYVTLDASEGLFLGQHVIIKPNNGTTKTGLWLGEWYILDTDSKPYVWANKNGHITKKYLTLGEYDGEMGEYEIVDGLTINDSIAFPDDSISEGQKVIEETMYEYGGLVNDTKAD